MNVVKWGRHRIRLMPGWHAAFRRPVDDDDDARSRKREHRGPSELQFVLQPGGRILDAEGSEHTLAPQFDIYRDHDINTADDAGQNVAAAMLAAVFHETIEWVTVDGRRLADPHPPGDGQWDWVLDRMLDLIAEYRGYWPVKDTP